MYKSAYISSIHKTISSYLSHVVSPPLAHDCSHPFGEELTQHQSVLLLNNFNPRHKKDVPNPNMIVIICIIGSARLPIRASLIPCFTRSRKSVHSMICTYQQKKEEIYA